jgi:hypothetical protein
MLVKDVPVLFMILVPLVFSACTPKQGSAQMNEPGARQGFLGLSLGAGSVARLAPTPCYSSRRNPESRSLFASDLRGAVTQGQLRLEVRIGVSRLRQDPRTYICPGTLPDEDGIVEDELHPRGTGTDVRTSDLRFGVEVSETLGLVLLTGVGRMWSHHQTYLATGAGVRRGDRVRLALDLESATFRHHHDVVRVRAQTGEEVGRERVREWRTGVGFRVGVEVPVWGQAGNR